MRRTAAASVVLTLLLGGVAACGGGSSSSTSDQPGSTSSQPGGSSGQPSDTPSQQTSADPASGKGDLPASFPVPPGARITHSNKTDKGIGVTMALADGPAAYQFWLDQLPSAGYQITAKDTRLPGRDVFRFAGNGWQRCSLLIHDRLAAIAMEH